MSEHLLKINREKLLFTCVNFARRENLVPANCPSPECLKLGEVTVPNELMVFVKIKATPPRLPPTVDGHLWDIPSACRQFCTIMGNDHRCIRVRFVQEGTDLVPDHVSGEW